MKRKLLYLTTIILTLAGCTSEDFVGDEDLREANEKGRPVSFNLVAAPRTRAVGGVDAANMLNGNFVVYARKTFTGSIPAQLVFDNYLVQYAAASANTTTSNSAGWEYVGYYNLPQGTKLANGGTANVGIPAAIPDPVPASGRYEQSIKYWDFAANQYDFLAYSLGVGTGSTPTYADASALEYNTTNGYTYTLTGTSDQLAACYISDLESKPKANLNPTNTQVQLKFRQLGASIKIALYETIPGYSVKDVKFYQGDALTPAVNYTQAEIDAAQSGDPAYNKTTSDVKIPTGQNACLNAADGTTGFNHNDGTFTVTFTNGTPNLTWEDRSGGTASSSFLSFGNISDWPTGWAGPDYMQAPGNNYIGRSSDQATTSASVSVLPNPTGAALKLKVDYTLLSRDRSEETIKVTGATAIVPAQYAAWKPNCSYTYIFKITDTDLYPITLDAVVSENADGKQETITTVTEPSITTYQYRSKSAATTPDEYYASTKVVETNADETTHTAGPIYIVVTESNGSVVPLTTTGDESSINAKLYTVTNEAGTGAGANPAQGITEESVANVLTKTVDGSGNYVVTDANNWIMTVSPANGLTAISRIEATDAPDGKAITVNGAKFSPTASTTYVFEYIDGTSKYYKVIKVASGS